MANQRILTIDSQILNTFQGCAYKAKLAFKDNVRTVERAEALDNGLLMHDMLEVYYSLQLDNFTFDTENWRKILDAGLGIPESRDRDKIKDFAVQCGRFFSTKMDLPSDKIEECIFQFKAYADYFRHDSWHPIYVEKVGSKVMFESESLKLIYTFKIDLVAEQGKIIAPFDHKTGQRRHSPTSMSNQFIGYCYGLNTNNIVINKIGFQKTLAPSQRFNRFILTIDDQRIEEWIKNTIWWSHQIVEAEESGYWPQNLTTCDKYSGCPYTPICETDPESRLYKIERDFQIGETWDPAKVLQKELVS